MMFMNRIGPLLLCFVPWGMVAEPLTMSLRLVDGQTGKPVADARIILNNGPAAEPASAEMIQKNRQFRPGSLVVARGSEVNFPNRDTTQHHVYSFSPAKTFNLELFADQPDAPVVFDKTGVVEVGCNIHDQMQGFILVTDSSLTAQTNASGLASFSLPAGMADRETISLSLWHPRLQDGTETVEYTVSLPVTNPVELSLDLAQARRESSRLDGLQQRFRDL
jgi:plastocyanin